MRANISITNSRNKILRAATEIFIEQGYGASVETITDRAGVARQTFYNHFKDKEELFVEVVHLLSEGMLVPLKEANGDLRATLLAFASTFREKVFSESGLGIYRILISSSEKFPELVKGFLEKGSLFTARKLAEFLESQMDKGVIRRDDSMFTAELLIGMLMAPEHHRRLMGMPGPSPKAAKERTEKVVDAFLRSYEWKGNN
ncbi:MAG: TetR/AcrR family transcriptional regulator [Dissulfuribacterales bacterium]